MKLFLLLIILAAILFYGIIKSGKSRELYQTRKDNENGKSKKDHS
jgi:hypothetical protein